jgi:hypothetical protein
LGCQCSTSKYVTYSKGRGLKEMPSSRSRDGFFPLGPRRLRERYTPLNVISTQLFMVNIFSFLFFFAVAIGRY